MGPVRMISSGHELTTDYDEKTLHELGFKDMQVNYKRLHYKPKCKNSVQIAYALCCVRWCSCLWVLLGEREKARGFSCRPRVCHRLRRSTSPCFCSCRSRTSPRSSTCWRCWPASNRRVRTDPSTALRYRSTSLIQSDRFVSFLWKHFVQPMRLFFCRAFAARSFTSTQRTCLAVCGSCSCCCPRVPACSRPSRTSRMKRSVT